MVFFLVPTTPIVGVGTSPNTHNFVAARVDTWRVLIQAQSSVGQWVSIQCDKSNRFLQAGEIDD